MKIYMRSKSDNVNNWEYHKIAENNNEKKSGNVRILTEKLSEKNTMVNGTEVSCDYI
jgi:hypothetical protein